jgi:hypothetical protein
MGIAKVPEIDESDEVGEGKIDKRMQWIQKIEKQILEHARLRFTGKLVFALNMSQGGITDGSIQTDSKLN